MIINKQALKAMQHQVVMVDGGFDPLHWGHIHYFEEAKKMGYPVLCNLRTDKYILESKNRPNLLPVEQRARIIDSLRFIDYVYLCDTTTNETLELLQPCYYAKGADWKHSGVPEEEQITCNLHGIKVVYLDTSIEASTNLVEKFLKDSRKRLLTGNVRDFEKFVFEQKPFDASFYDDNYFQNEWRQDQNSYSIEKRREIEGKNPQNIKDVFCPENVLDVGCGPGALMLFLHEIGVNVSGIDFSKEAKEAAPAQVREKIVTYPITKYYDFGQKFDLVICRETLEHLTILQVQKAVELLARYTSKYLYVTTRFHPDPYSFLDVTTEHNVDPSHITLLNKEFLRLMFVMQGLRSCPDLEARLDWKNYGRVLVFKRENL